MTSPKNYTTEEAAAWWCAVVEPGDGYAALLREAIGEEEAIGWAIADRPRPIPADLASKGAVHSAHVTGSMGESRRVPSTRAGGSRADWDQAWARWHPRAIMADPRADLAELWSLGGELILPGSTKWPDGLDQLGARAPIALWAVGNGPGPWHSPSVALVGARAATSYGERTVADMAFELAERGIDIVSGGAFGVDVSAHRGALAAPSGHTTCVQAGGLGRLYPQANAEVFAHIAKAGIIISEVPPSWRPAKWRFLGRNRVIAAMSQATIVIEASMRSGALATARVAMDLGRDVGALPGPVTSSASRGCHDLIREGATLVRDADDVREMLAAVGTLDLGPLFGAPVDADHGSDAFEADQRRVWEALPQRGGAELDRITRASGLSHDSVLAALALLELSGAVVAHPKGWARGSAA